MLSNEGKFFKMENIMPLTEPDTQQEVTPYKVYMCVGYLEQQGKLKRTRDGLRAGG